MKVLQPNKNIFTKSKKLTLRLFSNKTIINIISNYFAFGYTGLASLLLLPIYLKLLGMENWGIVAIAMSIQAMLSIFDLGFGQIMPASISKSITADEKYRTYKVFKKLYLIIGIAAFLLAQLVIKQYIDKWINIGKSDKVIIEIALRISILTFLFQYLNSANLGLWYGTHKIALMNKRLIIFFSLKHISALLLIYFWGANPLFYVTPIAIVSIVDFVTAYYKIKKEHRTYHIVTIKKEEVFKMFRNNLGLIIAISLGIIVTQIDKLMLTKYVQVKTYGIYTIVYAMAMGIQQIYLPVIHALLPKVVESERDGKYDKVTGIIVKYFTWFAFIPLIIFIIFSKNILFLWTRNNDLATAGTLTLRLLLGYVLFNTIYSMNYLKYLAKNSYKLIFIINLTSFIICILALELFKDKAGLALGGIFWITLGFVQMTGSSVYHSYNIRSGKKEVIIYNR